MLLRRAAELVVTLSTCSLVGLAMPALAGDQTSVKEGKGQKSSNSILAPIDSRYDNNVFLSAKAPAPDAFRGDPYTLKNLPRNILDDQKFYWLRPFQIKQADAPWAIGLLGTTAALMAIDRPLAQELSDAPPGAGFAFSRRVGQFSGWRTDFGVASAFYLIGRWRGDDRARTTGLLGFRAVAGSLIIVRSLKTISQRPRPTRTEGQVRNHNTDGEFFAGGSSFPSGHAAEAWALATVVAQQYRHRRWVPPTAYGLAGLVAVSRVTARKHFPTDIFVGSLLGYLIGRHVYSSAQGGRSETSRRWHLLPYTPRDGDVAFILTWEF